MTYSYIFFLGSHPRLSKLEVLRALEARQVSPIIREETDEYVLLDTTAPLDAQFQDILGGSDRFAQHLATFEKMPTAADIGERLPATSRKISVGLSGLGVDRGVLTNLGSDLKEWWVAKGGKMRFILPGPDSTRLNAASVMAHRLDEAPNVELTLVSLRNDSFGVFITIAVQDIRSYELRDTSRPMRDPAVGLLPPKLAQIMLNLAMSPQLRPAGFAGQDSLQILDPFCGMGTLLQEGWLMDHRMVGSDSSERMVRASAKNLKWLQQHFTVAEPLAPRVFLHQADTKWSKRWEDTFDAVVTEPFLGKPLKKPLPKAQLEKHMNELGELYRRVFAVLRLVVKKDGIIVFALPAFRAERGGEDWQLFPERFLDVVGRLGYSKVQLESSDRSDMLYARPQALVGRELTVWRKQ